MFKKPPSQISSSTPIRSSDKRKLLAAMLAQYGIIPGDDAAGPDWKGLVPDGIRSGKVTTSGGIKCNLYTSTVTDDPLWLSFGSGNSSGGSQDYAPTLYATINSSIPLHHHVPIIPLHSMGTSLSDSYGLPIFLINGAPLFIPAIQHLQTPWMLPDIQEGQITLYVLYEDKEKSKGRVVGVARCVANGGLKGAWERWNKASRNPGLGVEDVGRVCETLNIVGDALWKMGSEPPLPILDIPPPRNPLFPPPVSSKAESQSAGKTTVSRDGGANGDAATDELTRGVKDTKISEDDLPAGSSGPAAIFSTCDIDNLLNASLTQSLLAINPSTLPITGSTLYSAYILPNRSAAIPKDHREEVVIAKSSWKKVGKWLKVMGDGKGGVGLMRVKEEKNGGCMVLSINANHDLLQSHRPHKTIAEQSAKEAAAVSAEEEKNGSSAASGGTGKEISIEEFWRPTGHGVAFWETCGVSKNDAITHAEVIAKLNEYITSHFLANPGKDQRTMKLDHDLGRACGVFKTKSDEGMTEVVTMPRTHVLQGLKDAMQPCVRIGGESGTIKKGMLQPIKIAVKTRQGKKMVTLITGMETFGVDPDEMAEELKKICAGSATVNPLVGAVQKSSLHEVMVQGSQQLAATQLLMTKGVPRKWIVSEGDAKGKGKK